MFGCGSRDVWKCIGDFIEALHILDGHLSQRLKPVRSSWRGVCWEKSDAID
jgi:hypothetical protein